MALALKGSLEKLTWKQVRDEVIKVNPAFANIIDKLNPSEKYWIIKARYPYGSLVMQKSILSLPNSQGEIVPITDQSIAQEIRDGIGYNLNSNPVCLVLKNTFEIFLPYQDRIIPLGGLLKPGEAFGAWRILNPAGTHQPVFNWEMSAGARSVFMLPKITEAKKHMKIKKTYDLSKDVPKTLLDHWEVFRQLANHSDFSQKWDAEILYFSKQWFEHIDDKEWHDFYYYFHRSIWLGTEFWRNQPIWNLIFSLVLNEYQSRPSGYIMDTAKYLMHIGIGTLPGFAPARNCLGGPFEGIQDIYTNEYDIRNYPPIIMQPDMFNMYDLQSQPVYYSLQFPNALEFKPSSRQRTSVISDLHDIRALMIRYESELLSNRFNIGGTPLSDLFKHAKYDYFHNGVDLHNGMKDTAEMQSDINFMKTLDGKIHTGFPETCLFGKGCIRISHKKSN